MSIKLIQTKDCLLLIDEEAKIKEGSNESFDNMGFHSTVTKDEERQFKLGYYLGYKAAQSKQQDVLNFLDDIKGQINLLKDYEREQLHIANVSNMLCGYFDPDTTTSSATKCKCGREKWEH